jgi:hypothetical protein
MARIAEERRSERRLPLLFKSTLQI